MIQGLAFCALGFLVGLLTFYRVAVWWLNVPRNAVQFIRSLRDHAEHDPSFLSDEALVELYRKPPVDRGNRGLHEKDDEP